MKKQTQKYYFSVEGETEKRYLIWLQNKINHCEKSVIKVMFDIKIERYPISRVKELNAINSLEIFHVIDIENQDEEAIRQFKINLENMRKAEKLKKRVKYKLAYSNLTFELWIILHKTDFLRSCRNKEAYLKELNKSYHNNFKTLKSYKKEENFQKLLQKLSIEDVINAIKRSKIIMDNHEKNGHQLCEYEKYRYYEENPSLSIWEMVLQIMIDCRLMEDLS